MVKDAHNQRVTSAVEKAKSGKATAKDIQTVWSHRCREHFPKSVLVAWGAKERGQMMLIKKKVLSSDAAAFVELVEWAIENWNQVMRLEFHWMRNPPPDYPVVGFFVKWVERFLLLKQRGMHRVQVHDEGEVLVSRRVLLKQRAELAKLTKAIQTKRKELEQTKVLQVTPKKVVASRLARFRKAPLDAVDSSAKVSSSIQNIPTWKEDDDS